MLDCTQLTYQQMADLVRSIGLEVKERNPIMVNVYMQPISDCIAALEEISGGEVDNPTSESGPEEMSEARQLQEAAIKPGAALGALRKTRKGWPKGTPRGKRSTQIGGAQ